MTFRSCSTSFIHLVTRLSSMKSVGRGAPKNSEVYSSSRKLNTMTHSELKTYNLFKNEYRTSTIISCGLYNFYLIFTAVYIQKWLILQTFYVLNKEVIQKNPRFIIKSSFKSGACYNGGCRVNAKLSKMSFFNISIWNRDHSYFWIFGHAEETWF